MLKGDPMEGMVDWNSAVVNVRLNDKPINMHFSRKSDGPMVMDIESD